jgi:acyl-ACP thioesterase
MHVNNTRYIDYAFNCFTVEELSEKKVEEFVVAYVKQCREGDTLSFYRKDEGKDSLVCGYNQKGELVVRTKIIFS